MVTQSGMDLRLNMSAELANRLRDMIAWGELKAGERVNEVHLAKRMGVSRTPLREALTSLLAEEALYAIPRRGFFVQPLSRAEAEGIYPVRALIDPEALRLSGIPDHRRLDRLKALNEKLGRARKVSDRIEIDDDWHLLLIKECPNLVLLDLIRQFIRRTRRYEVAYLRETKHLQTTLGEHEAIMYALGRGDLKKACRCLEQNLSSSFEPVLAWLDKRERENA